MILIAGATGFVGTNLTKRLAQYPELKTRVLLRPGSDLNRLPKGVGFDTVTASLNNHEGLVNAMRGVHTIFHLIGTDTRGRHAQLPEVDVAGTKAIVNAALEARVGRIIYLSRVSSDRGSAYPILRAKGEIENFIRNSGLAYTIFQSSILFGERDRFSEHIAMLARLFPFFLMPGGGEQVIQPLWVEDIVTCLVMSLQDLDLVDQVIAVGGPELLSFQRAVMRVMYAARSRRPIINIPILMTRVLSWFFDGLFARWPVPENWVELLSTSQVAELGTVERTFNFRPVAFDIGVIDNYLDRRGYLVQFLDYILTIEW